MKILVIHGSMRKGNTYRLTKEIINHISLKPGVEVTEIYVADLDLPFCRSCSQCFLKGEEHCPHYDITSGIKNAFKNSDGVILSGATYMWALNAAAKNLLDHFAYLFHRPALFGKKGMVVATSKGAGEKGVAKYLKSVLGQWGVNGAVVVTQNEKEQKLGSGGTEKINKAADKFYDLITSGRQISPSLKNVAVHNFFRAMSLSKYSESECDTRFWRKEGFRERPYPVKASALKYFIGGFMYNAAKTAANVVGKSYDKKKGPSMP